MRAFHEVRSYDSDFMVWHSNYTNISFVAHWHKEIEFIYVRSGSCRLNVTDQTFIAHAGDLVVCESGTIHYSDSYDMDNSLDFIIFDTNILSSMYHNPHFVHPLITKDNLAAYGLTSELDRLFTAIPQELSRKSPYYQEVVRSLLCSFWYLLKRFHPRNSSEQSSENKRFHLLSDLQGLLSYIDAHYTDNITLEYAAARMNFSDSHFSKTFKKLMGMNFVTYLNMVRVEEASYQLRQTPKKITDIALSCGFNNIRTFNRVFKEITGYTPTEFTSLPDPDAYKITYYNRRSADQQFVEHDSLTLIKNSEKAIS